MGVPKRADQLLKHSVGGSGLADTVVYRGAVYKKVQTLPKELHYQGSRYVLAADDAPAGEQRIPLQEITVNVPAVVAAYNVYGGIKSCLDPFVAMTTKLTEAYQKATFRTNSATEGLKWIIDAGYSDELADKLEDVDRILVIISSFLDSFALMDAWTDRIYEQMQVARKMVLAEQIIKDMLPGDAYSHLVNSAKAQVAEYRTSGQLSYANKVFSSAKEVADSANRKLQKTAGPRIKEVLSPDGTVKIKASKKSKKQQ